MKAKKKKGESEKFVRDKRLIYVTTAIIIILILIGAFLYLYPHQPSQPKAAIIDQLNSSQLSATSRFENRTFVETAKELLQKRFPGVDYYSDNATVEQYRLLPSLGYKLIIWRAHSALDPNNYVAICSSERYVSGKYGQYSENQLKLCNITGDPHYYFAITPDFVKECMSGRFEDTVVIFMSCNGLKTGYYKTADTFKEKGVKAFISWNGWIDPIDNDNAIALLLHYLINENDTIHDAVNKVPQYPSLWGPSKLDFYPTEPEIANYQIPNYKQSNVTSSAVFPTMTVLRKIKLEHTC